LESNTTRGYKSFGGRDSEERVSSEELAGEDALLDQRQFLLDGESWKAFTLALDAPALENKGLTMLLSRKPAWERERRF
jgi:uncharacterized protein (DUF1778 family)